MMKLISPSDPNLACLSVIGNSKVDEEKGNDLKKIWLSTQISNLFPKEHEEKIKGLIEALITII